jgi:threonine/homoserine/homoserine lactone efflux protein
MNTGNFAIFTVSAALLLLMPGPTNAMLLAAGATSDIRRSLPLILSEIAAYALVITPLVILSEGLDQWRVGAGIVLKLVAAATLIFIGWRLWFKVGRSGQDAHRAVGHREIISITLVNPKGLVFAFAIFPPIPSWDAGLGKAAIFVVAAGISGTAWIALGRLLSSGRRGLPHAIVGRATALVLCLFAAWLSISAVIEAKVLAG